MQSAIFYSQCQIFAINPPPPPALTCKLKNNISEQMRGGYKEKC